MQTPRGPDAIAVGEQPAGPPSTAAAEPGATVTGVAEATAVLLAQLEGLGDEAARAPSGLPGWSRGHVLAHLARHADAQTRVVRAAIGGRLVPPYPGGAAGRAAEIEAGHGRPAAELVADVRESAERLAEAWRAVPPDGWSRPTQAVSGTRPLATAAVARWVEVGLHHVDLDLGPVEWPEAFVRTALGYVLAGLPARRRPDAAEDERRWSLSCPDLGRTWTVHSGPDAARVVPGGPGTDPGADRGAAGVEVEAAGAALLRWLTGRAGADEVDVVAGERAAARELPRVFPFP